MSPFSADGETKEADAKLRVLGLLRSRSCNRWERPEAGPIGLTKTQSVPDHHSYVLHVAIPLRALNSPNFMFENCVG